MLKVKFTPAAKSQFLEALTYVYQDNPTAAISLRKKAEESLFRLRDFPESGRTLTEFSDLPFREVVVPPYRFFYRVKNETVSIVAVWHAAQLSAEPEDAAGD